MIDMRQAGIFVGWRARCDCAWDDSGASSKADPETGRSSAARLEDDYNRRVRDPVAIANLTPLNKASGQQWRPAWLASAAIIRLRFLRFGVDAVSGGLEAPPEPLPRRRVC